MFGCILENTLKNPILSCFSHFLAFSQLPNNISSTPTKSKFIKTQILNTQQKKKIHQIRNQPKNREQQNKNHPRHHNNNKKIRDQREQVDRHEIDPEEDQPRASRSVTNGFDDFWVRDLRNGFDGRARRSKEWVCNLTIGFDGRARRSEEWVRDLTIGALLDERARSWVF